MPTLRNLGPDVSLYYPEGDVRGQVVKHGETVEVVGTVVKPPAKKAIEAGEAEPLPEDALIIEGRAWPTSRWEIVTDKKADKADAEES